MACRLCLCKIEDMLDPAFNTGSDKVLMKLIKHYFGFDLAKNKNLSQIVCKYCSERVKSFNAYCDEVKDNQKKLEIEIKMEEEEEEEEEEEYEEVDDQPEDNTIEAHTNIKEEEDIFVATVTMERPKGCKFNIERISRFIDFYCEICPTKPAIDDYVAWRKHMQAVHDIDKPIFSCCTSKLKSERSFLMHINKVHDPLYDPEQFPFECAICLKRFRHKARIRAHMRVHERKDEDGFRCKKCPEVFCKIIHWRAHQLLHDPTLKFEDTKFPCKKCTMELPTNNDLLAHLRQKHKRKFLCDLCAAVFNTKFMLQEHTRMVHTSENARIFQCPHCESSFLRKNNVMNHIALMHTQVGQFPCDQCDKVAITERQLKNHKAFTHQTDRRFICTYCQKAFKRNCDLKDHESIHTGKPLHKCSKCERMFNSKSNMQTHAKRCKGNLDENSSSFC